VGLARAIDLTIAEALVAPVSQIRPATYLGKGKVEEIVGLIAGHEIELVVMDCALSPIQQRNLEKAWNTKVLDRTGLILEIFGRRAKTKEGALQVELAHLNYQRSRLVRSWTHLERQRGGFGFMGGPGETQIEADRRLIGERITRLENEIKKVQATRRLHRAGRQRVPYRVVALVGYTNAGKSTLFNALTGSDSFVADQLFATLDPTVRRVKLAGVGEVVLADTVGFVRALPHELIAAFRSTLQEARDADLLLHVVDANDPLRNERIEQVREVLKGIGAGEIRELLIFNKIDLSGDEPRSIEGADGVATQVWASAANGAGLDGLREALAHAVRPNQVRRTFHLQLQAAGVRSDLYSRNAVRAERQCEDGSWDVDVELDLAEVAKLSGAKGVNLLDPPRSRAQRVA